MISSLFYFVAFAILCYSGEKGIRAMSIFGMAHIILENLICWYFSINILSFDLYLYLTLCWLLDIAFIFASACVLSGWKKKLTLALSVPLLFCQIIVMQFPYLLPVSLDFVINSSYQTAMEIYILCSSFKDNTIKEWIKTSSVWSCLVLARLLPFIAN